MDANVKQEASLLHTLRDLRYEVVPTSSAVREIQALEDGARVTITCSPKLGIERTVRTAEDLSLEGYVSIPHLAARQVRDSRHLSEINGRLSHAGVRDVVVLGGDVSPPTGKFGSALEVLRLISDHGATFSQIGITGYPEGHPHISEHRLREALIDKADYASYIVTQMCFSADRVRDWIIGIRSQGIELPVYIGVPGKVSQKRLLAVASKIGVGESLRYLRRDPANLLRILLSSEYEPEKLIRNMAPLLSEEYGVAGFHVYTFNAVAATERWRRELAGRIATSTVMNYERARL